MPKITNPGRVPEAAREQRVIRCFRGVDLTNQPAAVEEGRACNGLNMVRDVPGKVRKRMGYRRVRQYAGRINGLHRRRGELLVHAGTELYRDGEEPVLLYSGMADTRSSGIQFGDDLLLLDGTQFLRYDGERVRPVSEGAYVPTVTIARAPSGGGVAFEVVNMLQRRRTDSFLGTEGATEYQLSFAAIAPDAVTVEQRDAGGDWHPLAEGEDFTVDAATGTVRFVTAPGVSPVTGEDNVRITYAVDNADYLSRVNGCRFLIAYGAYGATDRVFLSGNEGWANYDFHSELHDPSYMGDIWYGVLGQAHAPITGYSILGNRLATHKVGEDNARNVYVRYGEADAADEPLNDGAVFPIVDVIQGPGAISPFAFGYAKEPIFLTAEGVCAATPYEFNTERYVQNRSFTLNGALTQEAALAEATAAVYREMVLFAVGGRVYLLDTMQKADAHDGSSDYQYEGYLWDNVPARVLHAHEGTLLFGGDDGGLFAFYTDPESPMSYNDEGRAIPARWDIDFAGDAFYRKKRVRWLAVRMASAAATSMELWCRVRGVWDKIGDSRARARHWSYPNLTYSKLTYQNDLNPRTVGCRVRVCGVDAVRFSIRNEQLNEPFGLFELAVVYTEGRYYKR